MPKLPVNECYHILCPTPGSHVRWVVGFTGTPFRIWYCDTHIETSGIPGHASLEEAATAAITRALAGDPSNDLYSP